MGKVFLQLADVLPNMLFITCQSFIIYAS